MSRFRILFFVFLCSVVLSCDGTGTRFPDGDSRFSSFYADGWEYRVSNEKWDVDRRGNHRAVVYVNAGDAPAVRAVIPWRRPDIEPESKMMIVTDATGREVNNVIVRDICSESGTIIFQPVYGNGDYHIYYLPYSRRSRMGEGRNRHMNDYLEPEYKADDKWIEEVRSDMSMIAEVKPGRIESRTPFDFWTPMGIICTEEEETCLMETANTDMVLFPEDRAFPIQFSHHLPQKWADPAGLSSVFAGKALRSEYYTWQIGVWAARKSLNNVRVNFSDLRNGRHVIAASEMTCFNQEGTNWDGSEMKIPVNVPEGTLQALWCGVMIPSNARPGMYCGTAVVSADDTAPQTIEIKIHVACKRRADHGDSDLWRHSRLRWLNSTIALDDNPTSAYDDMVLDGNVIGASGREVSVDVNGMVSSVSVNDRQVFSDSQQFIISTDSHDIVFDADNLQIEKKAPGLVCWSASSIQEGFTISCEARMEFDGHLNYVISLSAKDAAEVRDIRLVSSYPLSSSDLFMGVGLEGGKRPADYEWEWTGPYDSYWIGNALSGLHTEFRGGTYHGPLIADYKPAPAPSWYNRGMGRISLREKDGKVVVTASTGPCNISESPARFEFSMLVTPVKPLDVSTLMTDRYYHSNPAEFDKAALDGANISNIHHALALNPYINYPFIVREPLREYVEHHHEHSRKVKLYYTIRELSNHCEEIYAFKSLNHEILRSGNGNGMPWTMEHLIEDYSPAWFSPLENGDYDASLVLDGNSRFLNYWLEGLRWMVKNYGIDGVFMDDISFDRTTAKRMRKILDRYGNGARIDLHSNRKYSVCPANQYAEFFPYVDRLWFGEFFRYDEMTAEEWLVTASGIPFGLTSDMLQGGGNRYLGMLFGSTARLAYKLMPAEEYLAKVFGPDPQPSYDKLGADNVLSPVPIWNFLDRIGIMDMEMTGFWDPECPVRTSDSDVMATVYSRDGKTLISVGNFSDQDKSVRLDIIGQGLSTPDHPVLHAPAIRNFQEEASFGIGDEIPLKAKGGWLFLYE